MYDSSKQLNVQSNGYSVPPAYARPNYGEDLAVQQAQFMPQQTQFTPQQASNPTEFNKPWWSPMGSFGNFLFGTDTYQTLVDQGQDAWGRSVFGSSWDPMDSNNKNMYWTQALHNAEFSPNRYQGGLFNSLGSFRDISALGLGVAGLLNQKKMADRQYNLQKEAFDLAKEDYYNRESRAKEEFAARRNARSGGQI